MKTEEMERQNRLWQIPHSTLTKFTNKASSKSMESARSLQSGNTTSSKFTRDSVGLGAQKFNGAVYVMNTAASGAGTGGSVERVIGVLHAGKRGNDLFLND